MKFKLDTKVTAAENKDGTIHVNVEGAKGGNNETVFILFFFHIYYQRPKTNRTKTVAFGSVRTRTDILTTEPNRTEKVRFVLVSVYY